MRTPWFFVLLALASSSIAESAEPMESRGWVVQRIESATYSPLARAAILQGNVTLHCQLEEPTGAVRSCECVSGHLLLGRQAFASVRRWLFRRDPASEAAKPEVDVHFEFVLAGKPAPAPVEEFSFEFPNTARVQSQPGCSDHIPCPTDEIPAPPYGPGPLIMAMSYPALARRAKISGTATLTCDVDENGSAVTSCFAESGHPLLTADAIACVKRWRLHPRRRASEEAETVKFEFRFLLSGRRVKNPRMEFTFEAPNRITVISD